MVIQELFVLQAKGLFFLEVVLRSKLGQYCSFLFYLIGEGCNIKILFISVINYERVAFLTWRSFSYS